jgi:hypothetical protein
MAKTAKQLLAEQNQKKIKSVKKRPKKPTPSFTKEVTKKPKEELSFTKEVTDKPKNPLLRFCGGKSKSYSRKK